MLAWKKKRWTSVEKASGQIRPPVVVWITKAQLPNMRHGSDVGQREVRSFRDKVQKKVMHAYNEENALMEKAIRLFSNVGNSKICFQNLFTGLTAHYHQCETSCMNPSSEPFLYSQRLLAQSLKIKIICKCEVVSLADLCSPHLFSAWGCGVIFVHREGLFELA